MAFKINGTTVFTNTPSITLGSIINRPTMAHLVSLSANGQLRSGNASLSGENLTLVSGGGVTNCGGDCNCNCACDCAGDGGAN